jgi:hypothetical protein
MRASYKIDGSTATLMLEGMTEAECRAIDAALDQAMLMERREIDLLFQIQDPLQMAADELRYGHAPPPTAP